MGAGAVRPAKGEKSEFDLVLLRHLAADVAHSVIDRLHAASAVLAAGVDRLCLQHREIAGGAVLPAVPVIVIAVRRNRRDLIGGILAADRASLLGRLAQVLGDGGAGGRW